jgi:hypothetical protein
MVGLKEEWAGMAVGVLGCKEADAMAKGEGVVQKLKPLLLAYPRTRQTVDATPDVWWGCP